MIRPKQLGDGELLRQMGAGDQQAFLTIYRRYQGPLYRFVLHMSGSQTMAEDVTQEVFLALIQDASRFDPARGSLGAYLFGIGRNLLLRHWERDHVYVPLADEADDDFESGHHSGRATPTVPPADPMRAEMVERVRQATLSLPVNYREVVVLCDLQEMSYEQAAEMIGCAVGTVRSRLHRARLILTDKLRDFRTVEPKTVAGGGSR